jgi:DNA (cytosine-5)-methyltransferase 1
MTKSLSTSVAGFFAGVGGIELGFEQAGFEPTFANEIDKYSCTTYRLNHKHSLVEADIADLPVKLSEKVGILVGGFPCQAFSIAGYRKGFEDPRGEVYWTFHNIIKENLPPVIMLENVKNLQTHDGGKTFKIIIESLEAYGYHVKYKVINSKTHGNIPQNRERIYIVGFQNKNHYDNFSFPEETFLTIQLEDLIDFENKVDSKYYYVPGSSIAAGIELVADSAKRTYQWRRSYARINRAGISPALTANMGTGGNNVPLIHTKHGVRKLTPKECFNLMGFPKDFKLPEDVSDSRLYKQAGNAVVVPVIKAIAKQIKKATS